MGCKTHTGSRGGTSWLERKVEELKESMINHSIFSNSTLFPLIYGDTLLTEVAPFQYIS